MRILVLFVFFLFHYIFSFSQPIITFEKVYGGGGQDDFSDIVQTPDSGYLVLGSTENFGANSSDILLFKTDKFGIVQWKKLLGNNGIEIAKQIIILNNSYGILAQTNSNETSDYDILFYNIDTLGNIRNTATFGTLDWDIPNSIVLNTTDSTLLITANSENSITGYVNPSIFQISTGGAIQQIKQFSYNFNIKLGGIIKGNNSKFYSSITTFQTDTLGNTGLGIISIQSQDIILDLVEFTDSLKQEGKCISYFKDGKIGIGKRNQYNDTLDALSIVKCDTLGNKIWQYERFINYCISTISDIDDMKPLGNDNIEYVGYIESFQSHGNCPPFGFGGGGKDALIETVDENGNYISHHNFGNLGNEKLKKIIRTSDGGFISGGITNSYGNGLNEIYLIKSDSTGNTLSAQNSIDHTLSIKIEKGQNLNILIHNDSQNLYLKNCNLSMYKIYDINAREIQIGVINDNNSKIEILNISSGFYILRLMNSGEIHNYKFIK